MEFVIPHSHFEISVSIVEFLHNTSGQFRILVQSVKFFRDDHHISSQHGSWNICLSVTCRTQMAWSLPSCLALPWGRRQISWSGLFLFLLSNMSVFHFHFSRGIVWNLHNQSSFCSVCCMLTMQLLVGGEPSFCRSFGKQSPHCSSRLMKIVHSSSFAWRTIGMFQVLFDECRSVRSCHCAEGILRKRVCDEEIKSYRICAEIKWWKLEENLEVWQLKWEKTEWVWLETDLK